MELINSEKLDESLLNKGSILNNLSKKKDMISNGKDNFISKLNLISLNQETGQLNVQYLL
ncbi:MAG: hypothetical protein LBT66_08205 [Methanobrevibacter sp.]|jgi:hypothetical protein|nr:hypothetical protein [Candidatus Methanovirga meridionalis]